MFNTIYSELCLALSWYSTQNLMPLFRELTSHQRKCSSGLIHGINCSYITHHPEVNGMIKMSKGLVVAPVKRQTWKGCNTHFEPNIFPPHWNIRVH